MKKTSIRIILWVFEKFARVPWLGRKIYALSGLYRDIFRSYSYDFTKNGEAALIAFLPTVLVQAKPVIFDVGANKGDWTFLIRNVLPDSLVHCFELSPATYKNLENRFGKVEGIFLNQKGLSDQPGTMTFRDYGENNGGNTLIHDPCYVHKGNVRETVAELSCGHLYMEEKGISKIDFLKIDVEGWEYFVLKGFDRYLTPEAISMIQFEYGYTHGDVHTLMKDFYTLLTGRGYEIGRLTPRGVCFRSFHYELNDFTSGPNFIACSKEYVGMLSDFSSCKKR